MQRNKILISAIVGTSAMTLFSYLVSESENKNFREPEVLGHLILAHVVFGVFSAITYKSTLVEKNT